VVATAVVCSVCAAGMLMGGAFGTAAGVATCGGDRGCVGRSGLAGAAGGALLGDALSSAGSGAAGQFMAGRFDADALRRDALVGAGTGAAFHALGGLRGSLRGRGGAEPNTARARTGGWVESQRARGALVGETGAVRLPGKGSGFTADQDALVQLAKSAKRTGVDPTDAQTLLEWADELRLVGRGPEVHPGRPWGWSPHIHIGPINHIPVR
jgi:hypothetical protein